MDLNRFELWNTLLNNVNERLDIFGSNDDVAKNYVYLTFEYGIITERTCNMIIAKIKNGKYIETQDLMKSEDLSI